MGFVRLAAPTARTAVGAPMRRASGWYETVSPRGIVRSPAPNRRWDRGPPASTPIAARAPGRPRAGAERAPEPQVGGREGVRLAEGAHRDVVRRPRADAGDGDEARDRVLEPARGVQHGLPARNGAGERTDGRGPGAREADRG